MISPPSLLNLSLNKSIYLFNKVERAQRVPTGSRTLDTPVGPFLVQFLNLRDRDLIMAEDRRQQNLQYKNAVLHFFPDFSPELQKRRRSFVNVRKRLREKGL